MKYHRNYKKGTKVMGQPQTSAVGSKPVPMVLLEDIFTGGWDSWNVRLEDGTEDTVLGFNVYGLPWRFTTIEDYHRKLAVSDIMVVEYDKKAKTSTVRILPKYF